MIDNKSSDSQTIKIVQYSDPDGNPAYAYTHWNAIAGKPNFLLEQGTIETIEGFPNINYMFNDRSMTLSLDDMVVSATNINGEVGVLPSGINYPALDIVTILYSTSDMASIGTLIIQTDGVIRANIVSGLNNGIVFGTINYSI